MLIDTFQALVPLLCAAGVACALVLDLRLSRSFRAHSPSEDEVDETFALKLVTEALIQSLELRPELRRHVFAEVRRERTLVFAWMASQRAHGPVGSAES